MNFSRKSNHFSLSPRNFGAVIYLKDQREHLNRKLRCEKEKVGHKRNFLSKRTLKIVNEVGAIGDDMPKW